MGKSESKLKYFIITLFFGGSVALIGYSELNLKKDLAKLNHKSDKLRTTDAKNLVKILHGDNYIERASIDPMALKKASKEKDDLSNSDKSALKKLIEKVVD